MSTLFVCHVPADDLVATRIYNTLAPAEIDCWVDHLHGSGDADELEDQIRSVIRGALGGIFVLSTHSINDSECITQLQALDKANKRLYVLIWENITADQMPEWLNAYPWIDLTQNLDGGLLEFLYLLKGKPEPAPSPTETKMKLYNVSGSFPYWHLDLPLIGRDDDLDAVRDSLSEGHRGTLIQGFSGIGKTRLAAEIASTIKFRDGVVWYTFTPNSTLYDLAALIVDHLNLDLDPRTNEADLWSLLRKYQMLLVLDGAESCPNPSAFAEALNRLHLNRGTQLLITSRHIWQELHDVKVHEMQIPSMGASAEILKRMARAQAPRHTLDDYEADIIKAAHQRPRLMWYAVKWANFFPLNYVIELLGTLKGADAKDAYEELINKTLNSARRHDDWTDVESALRKLSIFRSGFTFEAARTLLGDPHPLLLLKTWGMVSFDGERYEIDPLLLLSVEADLSIQQTHYRFYRALAVERALKQDYSGMMAELDNLDAAFNYAMENDDLIGAFEIAQSCSPFMGSWARFEQRRSWLERIAACLADNVRDPLYPEVQIALGIAYQERPGTDRRTNLQKSVSCFERALRAYSAQKAPMKYAMIQNNLGITYRILSETDHPAENLQLAIHAFNQAMRHYGPRSTPITFAVVQNNLGAAYIDLSRVKDRANNLWLAVAAFRRALAPLKPTEHAMQYAQVNHNLGTAYGELSEVSDKKDNLERAIKCYARAMQIFTPQNAPMDYARTSHNLGLAYRGYADLERPDAHYHSAIKAFQQALRFWSPKTAPGNFASAQMLLGQTYLDIAEIEYQPSYLERSISAFQQSLNFYSIRNQPSEYVKGMVLVGIAYRRLGKRNEARNCWQKAEKYFRQIGMNDVAEQLRKWLDGDDSDLTPPRR
ncbi:MAG: toll/interleukin-1 receptor domain-containing protein [Anaerolineae bacterium]|nr:toll/interleukin-1 receptor domain-containing protein [Anaerolineae bacterium]